MVDLETKRQVIVYDGGAAAPYLMIPREQLAEVLGALTAAGVGHWTDTYAIQRGDGPAIAFVNLARDADPAAAQRALDQL